MPEYVPRTNNPCLLGIECGATRSTVLLEPAHRVHSHRAELSGANLRLLDDRQLISHFRNIERVVRPFGRPAGLCIAMAGARTKNDFARIARAAAMVWSEIPCFATNDLETALVAAEREMDSGNSPKATARLAGEVLVLSGTGSCCFGKTRAGKTAKVGGWGHILGDKGSGYEIGLRALKACVYHYDRDGLWPRLGQKILSALAMNSPEELIGWVQQAAKAEIASFTVHVFSAAAEGDKIARDILAAAADSLARDAAACAAKLAAKKQPIKFVLAGSVLIKQPAFAKKVVQEIKKLWPRAVITRLKRPGVDGAVELARRQFAKSGAAAAEIKCVPKIAGNNPPTPGAAPGLSKSPTEQRNPLSLHIDKMPVSEAIELMLRADKKIPQAILAERKKIERAVRWIAQAFRQGGRLIYVGAGTSGRLGILDASECPPTFRTQPEMVQGIIAGGQTAIWKAVEGAEDKFEDGIDSIRFRGVTRMDVVVGIAASGRTPFVLGALRAAKKIGAKTVLICFNPGIEFARAARPDLIIAPNIGPELLTGSTRLKAGTATKLILNILTTLAMVQIGKVISNLMIDLNPSNVKLRDRAVRIIQELTGVNAERAERSLEKSGWVIKDAWQQLK